MYTTSSPCLTATADLDFFSKSKNPSRGASSVPPPPIVTRVVKRAAVPHTLYKSASNGPCSSPPLERTPSIPGPPPPTPPQSSPPPTVLQPMAQQKRKNLPEDKSSDSAPRQAKRPRTTSLGKQKKQPKPKSKPASKAPSKSKSLSSSRGSSRAPEVVAPPVYRSESRSSLSASDIMPKPPAFPRQWRTDEDGAPGQRLISSENVVKRLMKTYKGYFKNPDDENDQSFEPHVEDYPVVELVYPNRNASERFILLAPKDVDHYNPIYDLEASLYTIVQFYCTDEQKALFGPIPTDTLSETTDTESDDDDDTSLASRSQANTQKAATPPCNLSDDGKSSLLRAFKRALNKEDGPAFVRVVGEINALLKSFKEAAEGNSLMQAPLQWTETGLPKKLLMRVVEENYQRSVGPNVPKLRQYQAFTSTVYGELMPSLIDEIARLTNLKEDSVFLDLGSGVGNVCVQASLQTGCTSFGVELMPTPAKVALDVQEQMRIRARMWGLRMGEVELEEGDMLKSSKLDSLMPKADVVLVDNKVFTVDLNEALRPKFLDLKEGAVVVSLAPFVKSENARLTDRNLDDISTIFDVKRLRYGEGSVSWGHGDGHYWVQTVDRKGYASMREKFEEIHGRTRSTRRSRG